MSWPQQADAEGVGVKREYFCWDCRKWAKLKEPRPWWGGFVHTKLKLAAHHFTGKSSCSGCLRMLPGGPESLLSSFFPSPLSKRILNEHWINCLLPSLFYQGALNMRDENSACLFYTFNLLTSQGILKREMASILHYYTILVVQNMHKKNLSF